MNLLLQDTEITGTVNFTTSFELHGTLLGEVVSKGAFTLGETGHVVGDIKTGNTVIHGKVEGTITVEDRCELKPTAEVIGNITAGTFVLEEGASFSGISKVGKRKA
jgi:cytoskeletal protein CcmA (bactofilin family)